MNYALSKSLAWMKQPQPQFRMAVTLNALGLQLTRRDDEFRRVVNEADLVLPDGAGLVWAMKRLAMPVIERIAGIDYMERLCRLAAVESIPVYFLGGKPGVAQKAAQALAQRYRGLQVAGVGDGYFDRSLSCQVAEQVRRSGARLLFLALGIPEQEKWLRSHCDELGGVMAVGVGGSFDVFAGNLKRAPMIWQKLNCEWLYRLIQEPQRLSRDLELFSFVFSVLREKIKMLWCTEGSRP